MKLKLSLLLNASIIASTPLVVSAQGKTETKNSKTTQEILAHDSDVYSTKVSPEPSYDDYDDVDSYELYWYTEAFKTHYDMTFAYKILKKLIGFEDQKLEKLPYKDKLKQFNIFPESEFDNISSQYTFAVHNSFWSTFIQLWDQVKFNYGDYLLGRLKGLNVSDSFKVADDLRKKETFKEFDTKNSDIYAIRTFVSHFEAIKLFAKHNDNENIKNLLISIFKIDAGINSGSTEYNNTLKTTLPVFEELKSAAKESFVEKLAMEVEEEHKSEKLQHDALLSARRTFGSPEYKEKIIPLVKQIYENKSSELLQNLKDVADSIYLKEKQKVDAAFDELKDKDKEKNLKERIDNARNVGLLRDIYADITSVKINEFKTEVWTYVNKTNGADMYNDFKRNFDSAVDIHKEMIKQKEDDKAAFAKKWRDFGANPTANKVDIKKEKDEQRAKLEAQLIAQKTTLLQLTTIKEEAENLYDEESKLAKQAIEAINSESEKTKKLEELKTAKDIEALKNIAQEAKKIKDAEDLAKAKEDAQKAVDRTVGSQKHDEYKQMLNDANDDINKLKELTALASAEYNNKRKEVEDIYEQLFDKKDFRAKIDNASNIEMLEQLIPIIIKENNEQQNAHIKQEAKDSVEKLKGSEKYDKLKQQLNNNPDDLDQLKEITKQAKEEFEKEANEVQKELDKLNDNNNQKQKIALLLKDAKNVASLRMLKQQAQDAQAQEKQDSSAKTMEKAKKKTNIAAIVAPLVIVPLAIVGGVLSWILVKRHRNKNNK
ncbi:hypothetical protein [Mycoplasmopsis opalescens]|uniref:hypothetical protein n=1 Tax=Mycoplasmopsis opalescens TaxID=114886 RepID=UPI0004A6B1D2|nr:hypothetical protein [Mycoplasmopsis opalescens]